LLDENAEVFAFGDRGRFPPPGVAGGGPSALNRISFDVAGHELIPPLASKIVGVKLHKGDRVRIASPGGGGYGDPADRSLEAIERDLRLGYTTVEGSGT
jgi:N-methylhydantoinase B